MTILNIPAFRRSADAYAGFYPFDPSALRSAVEYIIGSGVAGDVIEFGCYRGRTTEAIARAMRDMNQMYGAVEIINKQAPRELWVFDSFAGFPQASEQADKNAPHIKAGIWQAGEPKGGSAQEIVALCSKFLPPERISVIPGWFKDTLTHLPADAKFAMVHVDCDYYESTKQALGYLFEHRMIADGCTILFDDWYCNKGSPRFGEQKAFGEIRDEFGLWGPGRVTDWGPYGTVGRRFIVHGAP